MELHNNNHGVGLFDALRKRGFWVYFSVVSIFVFVLLTAMEFILPYMYGQDQPQFTSDFIIESGINLAIGLISAGIAWKANGERWINRPDTIKLDLNEQDRHNVRDD